MLTFSLHLKGGGAQKPESPEVSTAGDSGGDQDYTGGFIRIQRGRGVGGKRRIRGDTNVHSLSLVTRCLALPLVKETGSAVSATGVKPLLVTPPLYIEVLL